MNRLSQWPLSLIGLALLAGCGSDCPIDYAAFGEKESRQGLPASLPNDQCRANAEERAAYFKGRGIGIVWYCAGTRMFEEARLGRSPDTAFCPLDLRETALAAQRTGEELRKAQDNQAKAEKRSRTLAAANDVIGASEADLQGRTAQSDVEQLRALAITRGWLPNPAVSGTLPTVPPPLIAAPKPRIEPDAPTGTAPEHAP